MNAALFVLESISASHIVHYLFYRILSFAHMLPLVFSFGIVEIGWMVENSGALCSSWDGPIPPTQEAEHQRHLSFHPRLVITMPAQLWTAGPQDGWADNSTRCLLCPHSVQLMDELGRA